MNSVPGLPRLYLLFGLNYTRLFYEASVIQTHDLSPSVLSENRGYTVDTEVTVLSEHVRGGRFGLVDGRFS